MAQVFIRVEKKVICDATFGHFCASTSQEVTFIFEQTALF